MIPIWNNYLDKTIENDISKAIRDRNIMEGPILEEFEAMLAEISYAKYAVGTSSGTAAVCLALMAVGIEPGDEVIVPDLTFIATANAAKILGADVVVAPIQKERPLLDIDALNTYITSKTKAIINVDLNGRLSDCKTIKEKYGLNGIYIIDDACQAFMSGNEGNSSGIGADIRCHSFGITKTLTTLMGGCILTDNKELKEKITLLKRQGVDSVFEGNNYLAPGFNFKMPDVLAAVGINNLKKINIIIETMKKIDEFYMEGLQNVQGISFIERRNSELLWMTDFLCEDRIRLREKLEANGIQIRPIGNPLHNANYLISRGEYENSDIFRDKLLYLPSGPSQTTDTVKEVINAIRKV